jgi:hypothetical protein
MKSNLFASAALAATVLVAAQAAPASALTEVFQNGDTAVSLGGRLQLMGFAEQLQADPHRASGRLYLFQKQSRLELAARQGLYGFYSQLALGGEDVYTNNVNLTLLDMYAAGPLLGETNFRLGQFRVPYGRELMSNGGRLAFLDRSLTAPYFQVGRDVGAAIDTRVGPASLVAGLFTGGGRDVPQRYLPEVVGIPLLAARLSVGDADEDVYNLGQHDRLGTEETRVSAAWSGMFTRDSLVGHSTVLNVKNGFEKSLLLNAGYNPYIGQKDANGHAVQGQYWQTGLDGVVKTPLLGGTLSGEAELNYAGFGNQFGALNVLGGRLQAALQKDACEVALRYAVLAPDANFAVTNTTAGPNMGKTTRLFPDGTPIQELTPAFTYFINGERFKLMVDMPILFNAPIVTESGIGNYNLVNQPDATSYMNTPTSTLGRQLVFQLRGGVQYAF